MLPDIRALFDKLDALYFQSRFKSKNFNIVWLDTMGASCTNRNFNDEHGRYTIALNAPLLALRPRIEIISVILVSFLLHRIAIALGTAVLTVTFLAARNDSRVPKAGENH